MARTLYVPLDVNYADDEKIILAGERAELLYLRALCLAKRILSDGVVADAHLPRFGLAGVGARARKLVDVGLWERVEGGYRIVAWARHNKSAAEVEAGQQEKSHGGLLGAHNRWHRDEPSPDCPLCHPSPNGSGNAYPMGAPMAAPNAVETETETETSLSPGEALLHDVGAAPDEAREILAALQADPTVKRPLAYLRSLPSGDLEALIAGHRAAKPRPVPPWCGECESAGHRYREADGREYSCPDCHPGEVTA
jgi:hypothetical protein